jgi:protein-S-isoprenylcysteine O-methyltransferase Ste14
MKKILIVLGWIAVILFVVIYGIELWPHPGNPITVRWIRETFGKTGLIVINILIVLAFLALLPYRRPTKNIWESRSTFIAFVIALMTEMFGWPLLIFLISPLVNIPNIANSKYFHMLEPWPCVIGTALSIIGITMIAIGWTQLHRARGLITSGLYQHIRHPQYTGIFLFTLGWILHWPSFITIVLWPILAGAYVWLAKQEEKQTVEEFGNAYIEYTKKTKRFIPNII